MIRIISVFFIILSGMCAQEAVSLQLKWFHQFQFAGYYAALEKGFYEEEGLHVTIRARNPFVNNIDQVLAGEAQYGVSDSILLLYRAKGEPVVIVSPVFQHSPSVVLTLKSSGIDSPYKLENKKLIFYPRDTDGFGVLAMLNHLDVKPQLIREKSQDSVTLLKEGAVDALSAYATNEPFYFLEEGLELNILNPSNYGFAMYGDMLFTNETEAREHPERVERFRRASLKGWEYALENKEEIIRLVHEKYAPHKSIEHLRFEAEAIEQVIGHKITPLGTLDKGRLEYTLQTYAQHGLIDNNVPVDAYVFANFNEEEQPKVLMFTPEERGYLTKKKVIRLCIQPDWMPFEKNEQGKHVGMSADYMALFETYMDTPTQLVETANWNETLAFVKERKCDIIPFAADTPARRSFLSFTQPYLTVPMVLVTSINQLFVEALHQLSDKKVGIIAGHAINEILKSNYPKVEFVEVDNLETGFELVRRGELFGFVNTLPVAGYQIQQRYFGQLKIATKLDEFLSLSVGVRSDEPMLKDIFDKAIVMTSPQAHQEILNHWVSVNYEQRSDYTLVLWWMAGLSSIFGVIVFFVAKSNQKLNGEIDRREIIEQKLTRYIDLVDKHIIISSTDLDGVITEVSTKFCEISGYSKEELIGKKHNIIKDPTAPRAFYEQMWKALIEEGYWSGEIRNRAKKGTYYWVRAAISSVFDHKGKKIGYTAIRQSITSEKLLEEMSVKDELTGVFNRRHFNESVPRMLNSAKRDEAMVSFAVFDVDFFKPYNDTYGHQAGDRALREIAQGVQKCLNRADDVLFRLGGEEFGIFYRGLDAHESKAFLEGVRAAIEALGITHDHNSASPYVTASFGLVVKEASEIASLDALYKEADDLLYAAKEAGRNCVKSNV
ncbi:MAG: ABC transporter substrate-binding protein [Campylobacterales bacterium]|nr:ABC transporter substrate-binding protein [Campylobacterales bacterium]